MKQLIVDGHNVMAVLEPYASYMRAGDQEGACAALIHDLASLSKPGFKVTLVFDGGGNPFSEGKPTSTGGIRVIYSPHQTSADAVIESLVREFHAAGDYIEVVSGDAGIQWAVIGKNVVRRAPRELLADMQDSHEEICETNEAECRRRVTLDQRISPEAAELLRRIRDGE